MKKYLMIAAGACLIGGSLMAYVPTGMQVLPDAILKNQNQGWDAVETFNPSPAKAPVSSAVLNPFGKYYKYDVADDHVNAWFFKTAGIGGGFYRGLVHCSTENPADRDWVAEWPRFEDSMFDSGEPLMTAACMVGDKMWAYVVNTEFGGYALGPNGIYEIDFQTGQKSRAPLYDDSYRMVPPLREYNCHISEMSYDPKTGYVYAIKRKAQGWLGLDILPEQDIVRIDPERPEAGFEVMGTIKYALTLAADDGYLYIIQRDYEETGKKDEQGNPISECVSCSLRKLDLEEYANFSQEDLETVGKINQGFLKANYDQTMEFDHSDHTLWWFGSMDDYNGTRFYTRLDTETAETDDPLLQTDEVFVLVALAIPYEDVAEGTPHYMREISCQPAALGEAKVDFSWTCPTMNTRKQPLSDLTEIRIYRDGQLYETLTDVAPGKKMTWSDSGQTDGLHSYKFVPVNSNGIGISRQRNVFIGHDVPEAPSNAKVVTDGIKATISWDAPVIGANTGWFEPASLVYDIVRLPDNKVVANDYKETSIVDEATRFMGYTYKITAKNVDGVGNSITTKNAPFGPAMEIPYLNEFRSQVDANQITYIDANEDNSSFMFGITPAEPGETGIWYSYNTNAPDEYVVLPPLQFEEGQQYKIFVRYAVSNYANAEEKIEIRQGTKNEEASLQNVVATWNIPCKYGDYEERVAYITDASLGNVLALRLCSKPEQGWVVVKKFEVREYSECDVSVIDFDGPLYAYTGGENFYNVTVRNEGRATITTAKAQLLSYPDGKVLGEIAVPSIAPGESKEVGVPWLPTELGEMNVTARVVLEGDTYEGDNESTRHFNVKIREGEPSMWRTVLASTHEGYRPFYTEMGAGLVETIYFPEEIGVSDITITGISYMYRAADEYDARLRSVPVELYITTTIKKVAAAWKDDGYGGGYYGSLLPDRAFVKVYSGRVNMAGTEERNEISMILDKPFYYDGKTNLVIRNVENIEEASSTNPHWFVYDEQWKTYDQMRSAYYGRKASDIVKVNDQVPMIKISYKKGNATGAEGTITIGADVKVVGNSVIFDEDQDRIVVYTAYGMKVAEVSNASQVSDLPRGVYVVNATRGANVATAKVAIK